MESRAASRGRPCANHRITAAEYEAALSAFKGDKKWSEKLGTNLARDMVHFTPMMFARIYNLLDSFVGIGLKNCRLLPTNLSQSLTNVAESSDLIDDIPEFQTSFSSLLWEITSEQLFR